MTQGPSQLAALLSGRDIFGARLFPMDDWAGLARDDQWAGTDEDWLIWLLLGGRGAGKTRAGAEWIRAKVRSGARRIALVAPTFNDAREVMLSGESGLLSLGHCVDRPKFIASRQMLEWPGGAVGHVFSAEDPDGLRGPQFDCAWADEFCAWRYPEDTLSNLRLALRLGTNPQLTITTTPRPIPALRTLMKTRGLRLSHAATADNAVNLSPVFLKAMRAQYGGTRLGRQELGGEFLEDMPGALFTRALIETARGEAPDDYDKIIVAIDPPITSQSRSDACGIIVAGLKRGRPDHAYILKDGTVQGISPDSWARRALALWELYEAEYLLAEVNQGGEMVAAIINSAEPAAIVRTVYASRGKAARAEPVAALYEQGRVHHCTAFPELEDELCLMGTEAIDRKSPDRADALVWAVTDLLLQRGGVPRIRTA